MKRSTVMNETALTNTHIVWRGLRKGILILQIHGILNAPTSKTKFYLCLKVCTAFSKKTEAFEVWHLLRNMMAVYQIQRWQHSHKTTVFSVSKHCPSSTNTADPHWSWLNLQTWWWCLLTWHVCWLTLMFNVESLYILSSSVEGPCFMPTFPFRTHLLTSPVAPWSKRAPERWWKNCSKMDRSHVGAGREHSSSADLQGHIGPEQRASVYEWQQRDS
jgi:hypothetical protein